MASASGSANEPVASSSKGIVHSAETWQTKGNIYYKNKDYASAVKYYTRGLGLSPDDILLLSNRCVAYLKLRCFRRALEDSEKVLELEPDTPKVIYRKVKALFGLDRFDVAIKFIEHEKKQRDAQEVPETAAAIHNHSMVLMNLDSLLDQAKIFLHQQQTGEYDMTYFLKNSKIRTHECADYTGPVEITVINEYKGRGLRATKSIKAGELVLVSKAICMLYEGITKLPQIENRILHEKELLVDIYSLYAGPELKYIEPNDPKFDYTKIDLQRLEKAFILNNFTNGPTVGCFYDTGTRPKSNGLFYLPSFINHSCFESNCFWSVYGDVMFVRACRDIEMGEEILISYCKSIGVTYNEKLQLFQRFGFDCSCTLCEMDKKDEENNNGIHERRNQLLEQVKSLETSEAIVPVIQQLEKLSEGQNPMYLVDPYYDLGLAYSDDEKYAEAAEAMTKSYHLIAGTPVSQHVILILIWNIIHELVKAGDEDSMKKVGEWLTRMKSEANIVFGRNSEYLLKNTATEFIAFLKQNNIEF